MILALFGSSLAGKTTVATDLASELSLPLRRCGELVKSRAIELDVPVPELSDTIHKEIDAETIAWVNAQDSGCIVEGRFLDAVLASRSDVCFVRLEASYDVRVTRSKGSLSLAQIKQRDSEDQAFRERLFTQRVQPICCQKLNTSELSVLQCVAKIKSFIA
jgi:cytidylate kinase